jgi:hypothetical protein
MTLERLRPDKRKCRAIFLILFQAEILARSPTFFDSMALLPFLVQISLFSNSQPNKFGLNNPTSPRQFNSAGRRARPDYAHISRIKNGRSSANSPPSNESTRRERWATTALAPVRQLAKQWSPP